MSCKHLLYFEGMCQLSLSILLWIYNVYLFFTGVYAALWPFLGILVEMIVLGIIIFIFEKRRAKAEFDESDTDQGNDQ